MHTIVHLACCLDRDTAICGLDLNGEVLENEAPESQMCSGCTDLDEDFNCSRVSGLCMEIRLQQQLDV